MTSSQLQPGVIVENSFLPEPIEVLAIVPLAIEVRFIDVKRRAGIGGITLTSSACRIRFASAGSRWWLWSTIEWAPMRSSQAPDDVYRVAPVRRKRA